MRNGLHALPVGLPAAALVTLLAGPIAPCVWAQYPDPSRQGATAQPRNVARLTNESFTALAAQANMAELQFSQLAIARSQNQQIQKFAEQMLTDHGKAGSELKQLANTLGVAVPTSIDAKDETALNALRQQQGQPFDTAYVKRMQQDHDAAVTLFELASETDTLDASLRAFARKMLPTLKTHQELARKLDTTVRELRPISAVAPPARRVLHVYHVW